MKRRSKLQANYTKAILTSINVLKKYKINKTPIDIHYIIEQIPNIKICKYSWMTKRYGCTIKELIDFFQSELGTIVRNSKENKYIIYYNDTIGNSRLDRFTIAHELGHFFLGHFNLIIGNILNGNSLFSAKQYKTIENEANAFARNLLVPIPLYNRLNHDSPTLFRDIMDIFDISYGASIARIDFAEYDKCRITDEHVKFFNSFEIDYYWKEETRKIGIG